MVGVGVCCTCVECECNGCNVTKNVFHPPLHHSYITVLLEVYDVACVVLSLSRDRERLYGAGLLSIVCDMECMDGPA